MRYAYEDDDGKRTVTAWPDELKRYGGLVSRRRRCSTCHLPEQDDLKSQARRGLRVFQTGHMGDPKMRPGWRSEEGGRKGASQENGQPL